MRKTSYDTPKTILKYPENTAVSVTIDTTAFATVIAANAGVIPAGTILHFDLENLATKAVPVAADKAAAGILLNDVDTNRHEADAAPAVIQGFIDLTKLPVAPTAADKTALKQIVFLA